MTIFISMVIEISQGMEAETVLTIMNVMDAVPGSQDMDNMIVNRKGSDTFNPTEDPSNMILKKEARDDDFAIKDLYIYI